LLRGNKKDAGQAGMTDFSRISLHEQLYKSSCIKGICRVGLEDGTVLQAELHWYEGHGIGKKEIKIKRYL